jgi:tRNA U34 5-methylaminomethyl-2-thiouridine-forming methyltransferase MnmC
MSSINDLSIITTGDGSHSLVNIALDETYHSRHGAVQESRHVFIKNGLEYCIAQQSPSVLFIFEVGFGTGLNALLTLQQAGRNKQPVRYTTVELYPLDNKIWQTLNYAESPDDKANFNALHTIEWNVPVAINAFFEIHKIQHDILTLPLTKESFDLVYFDAFAPSKQPHLWEVPLLDKMVQSLKAGGVFVTYCAKGKLKRDLKSLGLIVETLPGPPGKREMIRALKK